GGTDRPEWRDRAAAAELSDRLAEAAATLDPQSAAASLWIAARRSRRGDAEGAIDAAERAVAVDPESATAWRQLADSRAKLDQLEAAVDAVRRAAELKPGDVALLAAKASILRRRAV